MKKAFALITTAIISVSIAFAQNQNGLGIKKGQLIKTILVSSQTMEMGGGMEMKSDVQSEYDLAFADLTADSLYTLHTTFNSIKATADGMGQSQKYDSKTGEGKDSEIGVAFHNKIGKTDTIMLNRNTARLISNEDSALANPMASLNNNSADISSVIENLFFLLPEGKKSGDKWETKSKTNGIDSETKYELKSLEGNVAKIEYKTKVDGSAAMELQGMAATVNTKGKLDGDFLLEIETGLIQQKTIESDLNSTMELMGQQMEMSVKGKTTVTNTLK